MYLPYRWLSGKVTCGKDCCWGERITVNVSEELVIGDRCVIPDNAHFEGRRIVIGDDFYGASHWGKRLEIGLNRFGDEDAVLTVGKRCTFHDNRIDLSKSVTIGDDVGLSPEVCIYTHGYWNNPLEGFPMRHAPVVIGDGVIVGFRSTILAGTVIEKNTTVGAGSVVTGKVGSQFLPEVWGGVPARVIHRMPPTLNETTQRAMMIELLTEYVRSLEWRMLETDHPTIAMWPCVRFRGCSLNLLEGRMIGEEDEFTDDLRDFLFKHGIRIVTQRPFHKMRSQQ